MIHTVDLVYIKRWRAGKTAGDVGLKKKKKKKGVCGLSFGGGCNNEQLKYK